VAAPGFSTLPVLLVDDEVEALESYELLLNAGGIENVVLCNDSRELLPLLRQQEVGTLLLDLFMPHVSGESLLTEVRREYPEVPVIILTGANRVETAVRCMRDGAFDYLVKPVEEARLLVAVRRALELRELRQENTRLSHRMLSETLEHPAAFHAIVTDSPRMRSIFRYIEAVAPSNMPILISGETGVGKELVARAVHDVSGRSGAFVPLNIAGLDDSIFSDTLFGHERGAFTGADHARRGMIEQAAGGTLFLDEIGDLSQSSQVKLLRVLQEREYLSIGSDVPKLTDARVVAATNRTVEELRSNQQFRKDLFFRLHTHHVQVPPLRERPEDIPPLVTHVLTKAAASLGKKVPTAPPEIITLLRAYAFPGNIRELEAMLMDAVSNHRGGMLSLAGLRAHVGISHSTASAPSAETGPAGSVSFQNAQPLPTLKLGAQMLIDEALRRAEGNQTVAARLLGISQSALSRRLKQ